MRCRCWLWYVCVSFPRQVVGGILTVRHSRTFQQTIIAFYMVQFQGDIIFYFATLYALAMASTSLAALVGAAIGGNSELALQFLVILFMPQLLFAGYFVTPSLIPIWLRWVRYLCPAVYAVRLLLIHEMTVCSSEVTDKERWNCNMLLENVEAVPDHSQWYWLLLIIEFVVFRMVAMSLLRLNATPF